MLYHILLHCMLFLYIVIDYLQETQPTTKHKPEGPQWRNIRGVGRGVGWHFVVAMHCLRRIGGVLWVRCSLLNV